MAALHLAVTVEILAGDASPTAICSWCLYERDPYERVASRRVGGDELATAAAKIVIIDGTMLNVFRDGSPWLSCAALLSQGIVIWARDYSLAEQASEHTARGDHFVGDR